MKLRSLTIQPKNIRCIISNGKTIVRFIVIDTEYRNFLVEVNGKLMSYHVQAETLKLYPTLKEASNIFYKALRKHNKYLVAQMFKKSMIKLTAYHLLTGAKNINDLIKALEFIYRDFREMIPFASTLLITKIPVFDEPILTYSQYAVYYFSYKDGDKTLRIYANEDSEKFFISTDAVSEQNPCARPITINEKVQQHP